MHPLTADWGTMLYKCYGIAPRLTAATHVVHNLRVPMRDGVELALDLIRPDLPGPLPVVLSRTPGLCPGLPYRRAPKRCGARD